MENTFKLLTTFLGPSLQSFCFLEFRNVAVNSALLPVLSPLLYSPFTGKYTYVHCILVCDKKKKKKGFVKSDQMGSRKLSLWK